LVEDFLKEAANNGFVLFGLRLLLGHSDGPAGALRPVAAAKSRHCRDLATTRLTDCFWYT
jgi:hypothetical protein